MRGVVVVAVIACALAACGRIGFEPGSSAGDGGADATPGAPFTIELPAESGIVDLGILPDGGLVAVGSRNGNLMIDGVLSTGVGALDVAILALDSDGGVRWIDQYGSTENDAALAVAIGVDGSIYVGGVVEGTSQLGGFARPNLAHDAFLAKYAPDGTHIWDLGFGGSGDTDRITDIAIAPDGDLVVVGECAGSVDFGAGATAPASSGSDAFVARFSPAGAYHWNRRFGLTGANAAVAVVATDDSIYVGGYYEGTPDFGTGALPARGGSDAFVMRLDAAGTMTRWVSTFGGPNNQRVYGLAALGSSIVATGYYWDDVDLPGITTTAQDADGLVVAYAQSTGALSWARRYGAVGCDYLYSAHSTGAEVIAAGMFSNTIQLDGAATSAGMSDGLAFAVDETGFAWHRTVGNETDEIIFATAGSLSSALYAAGSRDLRLDSGCYAIAGQVSSFIRRY